jgi:hypothetical protein
MDLKQREPKWPYLRAINVLLSSVSVYILCTLFLFEDSIIPIQIRCYKFTHNFILRPSDLKYTAETILNEIINVLI